MRRNGQLIAAAFSAVTFAGLLAGSPGRASGPATTSAPATASSPAEGEPATAPVQVPEVQWHAKYAEAVADACQRRVPLLVIYLDPSAPACQAFEAQVLSRPPVRRYLADFAAVKMLIASEDGKVRFEKAGGGETPLTQVLAPDGALLDSFPGCVLPAAALTERLDSSLACYRATTRPATAAALWAAVQARLRLSTRRQAVGLIDELGRLPQARLPAGLTPGRLALAKALALRAERKLARPLLAEAARLAGDDQALAAEVLLEQARLEEFDGEYEAAHARYSEYVAKFPAGPAVGQCCYAKAVLEYEALKDRPAAIRTLDDLVKKYPDDEYAPRANALRELLAPEKPRTTTKPKRPRPTTTTTTTAATRPATLRPADIRKIVE